MMDWRAINMNKFVNRITEVWDYPKLSIYNNQIESDNNFFRFLKTKPKKHGFRLYIHIPFCRSFCTFCQFYKEMYPRSSTAIRPFVDALLHELNNYSETVFCKENVISSIFFGGGDPSIIPINIFEEIMAYIKSKFSLSQDISISVEGNVKSLLDRRRLDSYKKHNVNRISFGVQTFNEMLRKKLGIKPTIEEIEQLVAYLKMYAFDNFAIDLMYNLPDQSDDVLKDDIEKVIKLQPDYIDFYSLNLYPNTKFYDDIFQKDKYSLKPSKSREHKQNVLIHELMCKKGYGQVISCTYSNRYRIPHKGLYDFLNNENMIGVGPSARSYVEGFSYRNYCDNKMYIRTVENNKFPIETGRVLSDEEVLRRQIIFDVNLLKIPVARVRHIQNLNKIVNELIKNNYLNQKGEFYYLSDEGKGWVGNIQKCFFSQSEEKIDITNLLTAVKQGRSAYNQDFMSVIK